MEDRDIRNQRTGLIVVSILLFLSVVGNVILLLRTNRLSDSRDQALAQVQTTSAQYEEQSRQVQQLQTTVQTLRSERAELETELNTRIQERDTQLGQTRRRATTVERELEDLRQENQGLQQRYSSLEQDHQATTLELEQTRDRLRDQTTTGETIGDSISMVRPLQAYNIRPLTFWDRWLCADRYNVTRARRVDETHVSLEVAGTVFSPQGTREVHLVMIDPDGEILNGNGQSFENRETGDQMPYSSQTSIDFTSDPVPVDFVVEHDQRLQPGQYQLQVYIDGRLSRTGTMNLE